MKLAVIGDVHGFWDDADTAFFNTSDYDALLFVGDFAKWTDSLPVARQIAKLTKPAWAIAGNHDAVTTRQLWSEIRKHRLRSALYSFGMERRVRQLKQTLDPVRLRAYSLERLGDDLGLIVARPHAMGGDDFYFRRYLQQCYGIGDFAASTRRLQALIGVAPERLIMLAHNGPAGLGDAPDAPFGCDFDPSRGDFGDPDLRDAVAYARAGGREVLAVVAGHMHHRNPKTKMTRRTWVHDGQTLFLNAACVPRIKRDGNGRHHLALSVGVADVRGEIVHVDARGNIESVTPIGTFPNQRSQPPVRS